jgi:ABC-type Fe3+ transport system substrate-binding protein
VLITPPSRRYDLACGFTARWELMALAPGALGADRTTWDLLDQLADVVADVVQLETADAVAYVLNGQSLPAYLLTFEEGL